MKLFKLFFRYIKKHWFLLIITILSVVLLNVIRSIIPKLTATFIAIIDNKPIEESEIPFFLLVFYNGKEDFPTEKTLKLSDTFIFPEEKYETEIPFSLELLVKVVNINIDKENPILKRCKILDQYSEFVELVRNSIDSGTEDPFTTAISSAVKQGFLSNYLARKASEVENMLMTEYDYDTDVAVQREEAAEQAKIETAKNLLGEKLSVEQVARCTGLSLETVQKLAEEQNT